MVQRNIEFVPIDVNEFYDEKDDLKIEKLKIRIREINPSLVLISICFSETLDIRFALEILGIFPEMRLQRGLQLATKGKQIKLDPTMEKTGYLIFFDNSYLRLLTSKTIVFLRFNLSKT